jgi:PAS domain S-box-containing protein
MTAKGHERDSGNFLTLRERAEALLQKSTEEISEASPADLKLLVHELQVHQAELEIQNEELRRTQLELEDQRDRYSRLYNLAPVGYLTLDEAGVIEEANLTAAGLLHVDRRSLRKEKFARFVLPESQDEFYLHRRLVASAASLQTCELNMRRSNGGRFTGRLESSTVTVHAGEAAKLLIALSDVTAQRQIEGRVISCISPPFSMVPAICPVSWF